MCEICNSGELVSPDLHVALFNTMATSLNSRRSTVGAKTVRGTSNEQDTADVGLQ